MQALKLKFKNLFNPSKRKKYKKSIVVSNPCDRKIWDHCTSIQDKISKSTPVKDRLLETPEGRSPSVIRVLLPVTKTNNGKSSRKTLAFGQERLQTSEKENNDNLDQYLNVNNLPEHTCLVKKVKVFL